MADQMGNGGMNRFLAWLVLLVEIVIIAALLFALFSLGFFVWRVLS